MTIEVCNHVHTTMGQCLRPMNHEGRHYWRAQMDHAIYILDRDSKEVFFWGGKVVNEGKV